MVLKNNYLPNIAQLYLLLNKLNFSFILIAMKMLLSNKFKKYFWVVLTGSSYSDYNWSYKRYKREYSRYFVPSAFNESTSEEFLHFNEFNTQGFLDFNDKNLVVRNCVMLKRSTGLFRIRFNLNTIFYKKVKYIRFYQSMHSEFIMNKYLFKKRVTPAIRSSDLNLSFSSKPNQIAINPNKPNNLKKKFKLRTFNKVHKNNFKNRFSLKKKFFFKKFSRRRNFYTNGVENTNLFFHDGVLKKSLVKTHKRMKKTPRAHAFRTKPRYGRRYMNRVIDKDNKPYFEDISNVFFDKNNSYEIGKRLNKWVNNSAALRHKKFKTKRGKYAYYSNKSLWSMEIPKTRFKRRFKSIVSRNRKYLSIVLKKKMKHRNHFSVFLKSFIKKPFKDFFSFYELSLNSILLRSHFVFGSEDLKFFLKNKLVYVNNKVNTNGLTILSEFDKINFIFNKYYYYYYRYIICIFKKHFFKLYDYKFLNKYRKYHYTKTRKPSNPSWMKRLVYFRHDIPNFLEVDFITMTIIVIHKPQYMHEFNRNIVKYVTHYQRHLYNWRFII